MNNHEQEAHGEEHKFYAARRGGNNFIHGLTSLWLQHHGLSEARNHGQAQPDRATPWGYNITPPPVVARAR